MTCIHAYTENLQPPGVLVGYLSLNTDGDGRYFLTVRARGDGTKQATLEMSPEQLEHLATDILAKISGEPAIDVRPSINKMVDRFLCWKLPADFGPDAGISFHPAEHQTVGGPYWPSGTNLLHAGQAQNMIEHLLGEK